MTVLIYMLAGRVERIENAKSMEEERYTSLVTVYRDRQSPLEFRKDEIAKVEIHVD